MSYKNCLDYLNTQGLLPFSLAPFCEIDSLILSVCAYADFDGILPGVEEGGTQSFRAAVARLVTKPDWAHTGPVMAQRIPELVLKASQSPRFARLRLGCYESILEEDQPSQFAALTYFLPDGTCFLAFRGTDDTLVGWKESFTMAYHFPVPGHSHAASYFRRVAARHPGKLRLGGHSKGGNLAMWAAVQAEPLVRARVLRVYSHDGPGFTRDLTRTHPYRSVADRITNYVPQASIVGTLLQPAGRFQVIQSHGTGIQGQHDPFTWEVIGTTFRYRARRSPIGRKSAKTIHRWLESMDPWELEAFVDILFSLLEAGDAKTLTDLTETPGDSSRAVIQAYRKLDRPTRKQIRRVLARLVVSLGPKHSDTV